MADSRSFLDNLTNLRIVISVALEHLQANRDHFPKTGSAEQIRQAERLVASIRSLAEQLETEFRALETQLTQHRRLM
jgi:hypothetical protein